MAAPMEKTRHAGIYKRGSRYVDVWWHRGQQHKAAYKTLAEAREAKARRDAGERQATSRESRPVIDTNSRSHGGPVEWSAQGFSLSRLSGGTLRLSTIRRGAMRMLLKATMDTERASEAIKDGTMGQAIQSVTEQLKPEAAYFYPEDGKRTAIMVFDLEDPSQLPALTEPFFRTAAAEVRVTPAMNADDLRSGLQEISGS
jgi:hypothetical protein